MPRQRKTGEGWKDILGEIGKVVAPIAIDIGSSALKKHIGGKVRLKKRGGAMIDDIVKIAKVAKNPVKSLQGVIARQAPIAQKALGDSVMEHAPALENLAGELMKKLLGQGLPVHISSAQVRTLHKGGAITFNSKHIVEAGKHLLKLLPQTAKRFISGLMKSKGTRINLKHGEQLIDRNSGADLSPVAQEPDEPLTNAEMDFINPRPVLNRKKDVNLQGEGFWGDLAKALAPVAIDIGSSALKNHLAGQGLRSHKKRVGRGSSAYVSLPYKQAMSEYEGAGMHHKGKGFWGDLAKTLAPIAIDIGGQALKNHIGGGMYPAGMTAAAGGGIYPAGMGMGGGSIYPAGYRRGGDINTDLDRPIQLGSPYQHMNSPAMHPFMGHSQLSGYNPLPKVIG